LSREGGEKRGETRAERVPFTGGKKLGELRRRRKKVVDFNRSPVHSWFHGRTGNGRGWGKF